MSEVEKPAGNGVPEAPVTAGAVLAMMYDEYMKDERCSYTLINRLIEIGHELAISPPRPELEVVLMRKAVAAINWQDIRLVAGEGKLSNTDVMMAVNAILGQRARSLCEAASTLQSQARRVEELEGALKEIANGGLGSFGQRPADIARSVLLSEGEKGS